MIEYTTFFFFLMSRLLTWFKTQIKCCLVEELWAIKTELQIQLVFKIEFHVAQLYIKFFQDSISVYF